MNTFMLKYNTSEDLLVDVLRYGKCVIKGRENWKKELYKELYRVKCEWFYDNK